MTTDGRHDVDEFSIYLDKIGTIDIFDVIKFERMNAELFFKNHQIFKHHK